jgi:hypothetical protein
MKKIVSAFMGLALMLTLTVNAFAGDCCNGSSCCNGQKCCKAAKK